jgi:purine-nucleoside phosphorylase
MKDLLDAALAAYGNAHAPYSQFHVGAAVRSRSGRIFAGANVENAAYPEGNCAEASALAAMVAAGEREIVEVLVVTAGERLSAPCGGCRQRLCEFGAPQTLVHLCDPGGLRRTVTLGEILPLAFTLRDDAPAPTTAIDVIQAAAPTFQPRVGLILGSGLGALADALEDPIAVAYADLPGFPQPSVEGHEGRIVLGRLEGLPVACLQGRVHLYEGVPAATVNDPVRTLKALGCEILVLTNAAGSLRPEVGAGTIALIADHINLSGQNPLVGSNNDAIGPRFPDLTQVYDAALREQLARIAKEQGVELPSGVYLAVLGPSFETPAEIRAFRALGADLVGMSTVPEAISAHHAGLRVVGLSVVTNLAAGLAASALSHEETLEQGALAAAKLGQILRAFCGELADG